MRLQDLDALSPFVEWRRDSVSLRIPHIADLSRPDLLGDGVEPLGQADQSKSRRTPLKLSLLASATDPDTARLLRRWQAGHPLEPMRYYVCREVNTSLAGQVNRMVLPYLDGGVHYMPQSLLAAAYIAFQDEITGKRKSQGICANCSERYTVTRKDRIYCSPNCGKRASEAKRPPRKRRVNHG